MAVLQSYGTTGSLFAGTGSYTISGVLTSPGAGKGIIVFATGDTVRSIGSVTLSSSGTQNPLTNAGNVSNWPSLWYGTVLGTETNLDIVVALGGGTVSDPTTFGVVIVDSWESDQSGLDTDTIDFLAGTDLGGGASFSWSTGTVTPPTSTNYIFAAIGRPNRTWTEDSDFTSISVGTNLAFFGYILQSSLTAHDYVLVGDSNGLVSGVLAAFAGVGIPVTGPALPKLSRLEKHPKFILRNGSVA